MGCGSSSVAVDEVPLKAASLNGVEPAPQPDEKLIPPKPPMLARTGTNSGASRASDWDSISSPVSSPKMMAGQVADVDTWLKSIYMAEYADSFLAAGLTELSAVAKMSDADLERAGVTKSGHKKKMQKQCLLLGAQLQHTSVAPGLGKIVLSASTTIPAGVLNTGVLTPRTFLRSTDPVPETLREFIHEQTRVRVFKSGYAANAPCEDRHTVVEGEGFIFAGVWDGHTGHYCSEFSEEQIFVNFKSAFDKEEVRTPREGDEPGVTGGWNGKPKLVGDHLQQAFQAAYKATDKSFLAVTKRRMKRKETTSVSLFAGTCAVGAYVNLASRKVSVSNLGDSRAVVGLYEPTGLRTMIMSVDQTATDDKEKVRLQRTHPDDKLIVVNRGDEENPDWRVKGITQFTRSIGDWQMKDRIIAMLYNKYTKGTKVMPAPGSVKGQSARSPMTSDNNVTMDPVTVRPYIIPTPEYKEETVDRGFLVIASDGLWDELSNEDAIRIVAELLHDHPESDADIAGMLIEHALVAAAHRIVEWVPELAAQIFADVEHPTVAELKALPQGKRESAHRSNLHDDITAVVIVLSPADEKEVHPAGWTPKMLPQKKLKGRKRLENSAGDLLGDMAGSDETSTKDEEDLRMKLEERNAHILDLIDVARSFSAEHLRIIFDALDCNPRNGFLSREEAGLLAVEVLGEAAADDDELVDIIYNQMDSDNTSDVSWENFLQFFRVDADAVGGTSGAAVHGFRKIYGLLAEIPLFEGVSMAEYEDLARVLQKVRQNIRFAPTHPMAKMCPSACLPVIHSCISKTARILSGRGMTVTACTLSNKGKRTPRLMACR